MTKPREFAIQRCEGLLGPYWKVFTVNRHNSVPKGALHVREVTEENQPLADLNSEKSAVLGDEFPGEEYTAWFDLWTNLCPVPFVIDGARWAWHLRGEREREISEKICNEYWRNNDNLTDALEAEREKVRGLLEALEVVDESPSDGVKYICNCGSPICKMSPITLMGGDLLIRVNYTNSQMVKEVLAEMKKFGGADGL